MIPMLVRVRITPARQSPIRLWLPLSLLWLLLAPFVVLAAPVIAVVSLVRWHRPFFGFVAGWQLLSAARGLCADIQNRDANVFFEII